jgi:integrase
MEDSVRQRNRSGSVVLDKRIKTWNFFYWDDGKRRSKRIGTTSQYPTKASAWRAAKPLRDAVENQKQVSPISASPNVSKLVEHYRVEKMPTRKDTRRSYDIWLRNHIIPKWGKCALSGVQARAVELWLNSLSLAPKSKVHIRGTLSILWDFAMWRGDVPTQRNPMELVTIKGASKRMKKPRSLTVEEFHKFVQHLSEPFRMMALLCVCFGLRISEALALRWSDVDWLNGNLNVERGIVCQIVDDVKSEASRKQMSIDGSLLEVLKLWKQTTQFSENGDWLFASPTQLGRLPWSYDQVWRMYQNASAKAGIGGLGTHSLRHTYRSWLDAVGTGIAVQQKLMRHTDIRTTMRYGDVVTDEMTIASGKVAGLALNGRCMAGEATQTIEKMVSAEGIEPSTY